MQIMKQILSGKMMLMHKKLFVQNVPTSYKNVMKWMNLHKFQKQRQISKALEVLFMPALITGSLINICNNQKFIHI